MDKVVNPAFVWLERLLLTMAGLSLFSALSSEMVSYNLPISLWGIYTINKQHPRLMLIFLGLVGLSLIVDIAWASTWGHFIDVAISGGGTPVAGADTFGLVMFCFVLILKPVLLYLGRALFIDYGGWEAAKVVGPTESGGKAGMATEGAGESAYHMPADGSNPYGDAAATAYGDAPATAYGEPAPTTHSAYGETNPRPDPSVESYHHA